jgi:hypothetical protein
LLTFKTYQQIQFLNAIAARERAVGPHPNDVEASLMTDDPKKTALDRKLIALNESHEVRSWMESLSCSEAELRAAVEKVGHSAEQVRGYLTEKRNQSEKWTK